MLFAYNSLVAGWFSAISTFRYALPMVCCAHCALKRWWFCSYSMFFLLKKDGLLLPYWVLLCLYIGIAVLPFLSKKSDLHVTNGGMTAAPGLRSDGAPHGIIRACVVVSPVGCSLVLYRCP